MIESAVTLETKCWQGDWKRLLTTNHLEVLAERNAFAFTERVLMINNVDDYTEVVRHADRAVARGWISRYVVVKDHIDEALRFFELTPDALGRGYVYSAAEFVSIFVCRTPLLLHYASDCLPAERYDWVPKALHLLGRDPRVKVANLTWDHKYEEARDESSEETEDFYIGYGFSDQCWLVRIDDFRAPIYNHTHEASARYPDYGGDLFEKRVDAWMRSVGALRATYKRGSYIHQRRPAPTRWERWRRRLAGGA